jgi:hypothetical protein
MFLGNIAHGIKLGVREDIVVWRLYSVDVFALSPDTPPTTIVTAGWSIPCVTPFT